MFPVYGGKICLFTLITSYVGGRICSSVVTPILSHFLWFFFFLLSGFSSGYLRVAVIWGVTLKDFYFHLARQFSKLSFVYETMLLLCLYSGSIQITMVVPRFHISELLKEKYVAEVGYALQTLWCVSSTVEFIYILNWQTQCNCSTILNTKGCQQLEFVKIHSAREMVLEMNKSNFKDFNLEAYFSGFPNNG